MNQYTDKTSEEKARRMLSVIPCGKFNYTEWTGIGMALHHEGLPCSLWEEWSKTDPRRYHPGECEKKWKSFGNGQNKITIATLYYYAIAYGFKDDKADRKQANAPKSSTALNYNPVKDNKEYLTTIFEPDDYVAYVMEAYKDDDGKWKPKEGACRRTQKEILDSLDKHPDDLSATFGKPNKYAGPWVCINAVDGTGRKDKNITAYRYSLVENDDLPLEEQLAKLTDLQLPIKLLVYSGGKSFHALVPIFAKDKEEYDRKVKRLYDLLAQNGYNVDVQNKNCGRLSRFPGFRRNGRWQYIVDRDLGMKSFDEWEAYITGRMKETPGEPTKVEQTSEAEVKAAALRIQAIKAGKIFEITDQECGELIGQIFPDCRYNTTAKQWYFDDGKRWALDAEGMHIEQRATVFSKALYYYSIFLLNDDISDNDVIAFRNACSSLSKRAKRIAAIQDARKVRHFSSEELDANTAFLNCRNGVLNLSTFEFIPHDPTLMLSKITGCKYDPAADGSAWSRFLLQVMQDNAENIRFLQTYVGYMLSGEPNEDCLLILYGATTRNGKGTFCETLMRMFGDYGKSIRPESLAVKKYKDGSAASDDIARLAGVRFVNCSEPAKGMHLDEALVKSLTGGDTITARHLNERFFEFKPQFAIVMNVNYLPKVTDPTLFSSGRVMVLPFERHFSEAEQDKRLKSRLQQSENLSAVLNWAIDGLKFYRSNGLILPESVRTATREYADESDKIKRFFADEMEEAPGINSKVSEVYDRFVSWCHGSGMYTDSKQSFLQMLRTRQLWMKTGTVNGSTAFNVIPGYKLTTFHTVTENLPEEWQ